MQMDDDYALVERYASGDAKALEELVVKYQRQVYAFVYRMTGEMEESKDLTQKTFVNALQGIGGFRRESSFRTWLYQIATNVSLNHLGRNRREEVDIEEMPIAGKEAGALSVMIRREIKDSLMEGISLLPERQKTAVILRVHEGLSCAETARVMGCTEGAVKAHYHQAVRKLRETMRGKGYEIGA